MQTSSTKHMKWMQKAMKVAAGFVLVATFLAPVQGLLPTAHAQNFEPTADTKVYQDAQAQVPLAQGQAQAALNGPGSGEQGLQKLECNWGTDSNTWSLCLSNVIYVFTVGLMSIFAYIGGFVFDIAIQLTLSSVTYSQQFVAQGWTAVRDLANMAFIFMLVYIAMMVIFRADTSNTMKSLGAVIIVALLINFSFFASRLVIDGGNILAVQFYNAIDAKPLAITASETTAGSVAKYFSPNVDTKDLTYNIMQLIGVQTLLGSNSFSKAFHESHGFFVNLIVFSFIYIAVGIILAILAFTFLVVGFKFLIRIVMLWLVIIASPLAFVAGALGKTNKGSGGSKLFTQWYTTLFEYAFYPAVFLFMFWIVNLFAQQLGQPGAGGTGGILNSSFGDLGGIKDGESGSFLVPIAAAVSSVSIRLGLLVIMLFATMKASDKLASSGSAGARSASGWMGNKLSGAVAWGGRSTAGRFGYSYAQSNVGRKMAANNAIGKGLLVGAGRLSDAKYDVRGVKGLNTTIQRTTGVKLGGPTSATYGKNLEASVKSRIDFSNKLKPNEKQLSDAYVKAVKNLKDDEKRKKLIDASNEYAEAIEDQKEGRALPGALKAAKNKYDAAVKDSGVIDAAKKIAGVDNNKTYANSMTERSLKNLFGLAKESGTPFYVSAADKEAARKIRGEAKNDPDRLKKALEPYKAASTVSTAPTTPPGEGAANTNQSTGDEAGANTASTQQAGTQNSGQNQPRGGTQNTRSSGGGGGFPQGRKGPGGIPLGGQPVSAPFSETTSGSSHTTSSAPLAHFNELNENLKNTSAAVENNILKGQAKSSETVVESINSLNNTTETGIQKGALASKETLKELRNLSKTVGGLGAGLKESHSAAATPHMDAASNKAASELSGKITQLNDALHTPTSTSGTGPAANPVATTQSPIPPQRPQPVTPTFTQPAATSQTTTSQTPQPAPVRTAPPQPTPAHPTTPPQVPQPETRTPTRPIPPPPRPNNGFHNPTPPPPADK